MSSPHHLHDPWAREPVPLDGPVERGGFPPIMMAVAALILAFILFQLIISPIAIVVLLLAQGVDPMAALASFEAMLEEHARTLLSANTIGQAFGLLVPALLLARLSSSRAGAFLRVRPADGRLMILSILGLLALIPAIQWLGQINAQMPLPDFLQQLEQSQVEMIETILRIDTGLLFNLVVLAITPAICEEFLFRGYIQRQAERGIGITAGVLMSGIVFGLYHLRLTQALPLSALGIYIAYLAWRTGSIWPAVVVHFVNNALAVIVADIVRRRDDIDMDAVDGLEVPFVMAILSVVVFAGIAVVLHRLAGRIAAESPARSAAAVHPPSQSSSDID